MNEEECRDCIRRVLAGEKDLFERLVVEYRRKVLCYVRRILPDERAAEEVTDDTFRIAWERLERFSFSCRFLTWVIAIAWREALYRRRQLRQQCSLDAMNPETDGPSVAGPAEELEARARNERLYQALSRLPRRQREALLLYYELGLSYKQIARELGCSEGAVTQLLHRAVVNMGRMLKVTARGVA